MTLLGCDLHPRYQAGISIEQIRREGFDFMACKLSEGTNSSSYSGSVDWLRRGKAVGLLSMGYHYLRAGNEARQADVFCDVLARAGVPGMLDVEDGSGGIAGAHRFLDRCRARGAHVPLLYLPRWYWQKIGSPDLRGLPALWASRYPSTRTGTAAALFAGVPGHYWDGYGGGLVAVLQFSDRASIAGRQVDANAYRGTREQLAALLGAPAAASSARSKVEPVIDNKPVSGRGVLEFNTPIKGASAFYGSAFLSVRSTQGGHVDAWWGMTGKGGRGEVHWDLTPNDRRWTELDGGDVDQLTVHYDMGTWTDENGVHPADGAISVEFGPK